MMIKSGHLPLLFLLLLSLFALQTCRSSAKQDPELKQCTHQCKVQRQFDEDQKRVCLKGCQDYYEQKKELEARKEEEEEEKFRGRNHHYRETRYGYGEEEGEVEEEEEEEEEENPFVFDDEHFKSTMKTEEGRVGVLQKFSKRSKLLRGIENFRFAILEANPHTFVTPAHFDADALLFVANGRATISMLREEKRESFNLETGDVIRVPAGTPFYLINRDENEKLFILKLLQSVSIPGRFETFHEAGGEDPESVFTAFSWDVLQSAFRARKDRLEKLFTKQRRGSIIKASKQQIESLTVHESESVPRIWPFKEGENRPFNIFKQGSRHSNKHGCLCEAQPRQFKQLRDLNVAVSFANISKNSMTSPLFNSKSTKIAFVVDGEGSFQMACPHLSSSSYSKSSTSTSTSYSKIRGRLRKGVVYVVPAGHPFVTYASGRNSLQVLCFEVNAEGNVKHALAGKKNVVSEMEEEAKELAFDMPAREVDRVFGNQDEEFFFQGPAGFGFDHEYEKGRAYE